MCCLSCAPVAFQRTGARHEDCGCVYSHTSPYLETSKHILAMPCWTRICAGTVCNSEMYRIGSSTHKSVPFRLLPTAVGLQHPPLRARIPPRIILIAIVAIGSSLSSGFWVDTARGNHAVRHGKAIADILGCCSDARRCRVRCGQSRLYGAWERSPALLQLQQSRLPT